MLELDTHNHLSVGLLEGNIAVELGSEVVLEVLEGVRVVVIDISDGQTGGSLEADELAELALALHDAEGHVLLAAEGGQPADQLEGVDVGGDHDKLGLSLLDEGGHLVETELEHVGLLALVGLAVNLVLGGLGESGLLLGGFLGGVVLEESEQIFGWRSGPLK